MTLYGAKEDVPACGFGFGDCVIIELLKRKNLLPNNAPHTDVVVIAFNEPLRPAACKVAKVYRDKGKSVDVILEKKRVTWAYKYADRVGADFVVFVAPDEWAKGFVRVKNLRTQVEDEKETNVKFEDL